MYANLGMSFVVTLYLLDNETSLLVLAPQIFGVGLDVWKLTQASHFERTDAFPYFKLTDKASYAQSETKRLDEEAMKYLSYALYPLLVCYAIYSAYYNEHRNWYS